MPCPLDTIKLLLLQINSCKFVNGKVVTKFNCLIR